MVDTFDVTGDIPTVLDLDVLYGGENSDHTADYNWISFEGVM